MSFWEELGQKLTQSGQEAMQKTREIAGVVTMNADISDSKRKIRDLYAELGELVVNEAFEGIGADQIKDALNDEHADEKNVEITLRNWKAIYSKVMFIRSEQEVIAINEAKISDLMRPQNCKGYQLLPELRNKDRTAAGGSRSQRGGLSRRQYRYGNSGR